MTVLGIDYGTRWLGVALGQTETKFAFPYKTLKQERGLFSQLAEICRNENVSRVIIGLPKIWRGTQSPQSEIKDFGESLHRALKIPVAFSEEVFTSVMAERLAPPFALHSTHAQAATLIVENYFAANRLTPSAKR